MKKWPQPPQVSVIMATHNRAHLLPDALASALNQEFRDIEVLVVADGCSDATPELLADWSQKEPRLRVFFQERKGQAKARNFALAQARAPWIAFLDDDDLWDPNALGVLLEHAQGQETVGCLAWTFQSEEPGLTPAKLCAEPRKYCLNPWPPHPVPEQVGVSFMLLQPPFFINAAIFSRETLLAAGGFPEQWPAAEDYGLWLRLVSRRPISALPYRLAFVRRHAQQDTAYTGRHSAACYQIIEDFLNTHPVPLELPAKKLNQRLGNLARVAAAAKLHAGERTQAQRWVWQALRHQPWHPRSWLYLLATLLPPSLFRLAQRLKQPKAKPERVRP